ncbi:MAG: hypothetical protein J7551_06925, partial [Chloroflexi bacterium]|nr:hypothetical protein [Chloroflexota bacterium]
MVPASHTACRATASQKQALIIAVLGEARQAAHYGNGVALGGKSGEVAAARGVAGAVRVAVRLGVTVAARACVALAVSVGVG